MGRTGDIGDGPLRCSRCGYSLVGIRRGRCPECGAPLTAAQRAALGLAEQADECEQTMFLIEQLQGRGMLSSEVRDELPRAIDDPAEIDDRLARRILSGWHDGRRIYDILRHDDWSAADALSRLLDVLVTLTDGRLTDRAALGVIPEGKMCYKLYRKLRELGYDPLEAACRILPHAKSYRLR